MEIEFCQSDMFYRSPFNTSNLSPQSSLSVVGVMANEKTNLVYFASLPEQ
jgi:hypothetical protein